MITYYFMQHESSENRIQAFRKLTCKSFKKKLGELIMSTLFYEKIIIFL